MTSDAPLSPARSGAKRGAPLVLASYNGSSYRNGGPQTVVEKAFELIAAVLTLDALVAAVNIVELDPEDMSVGYGGLLNADGVCSSTACCMHGPTRRVGAVVALEGVRTPSVVVQRVLDRTDHHLLVGKGALDFARTIGLVIERDLNSDRSRQLWLDWKRSKQSVHEHGETDPVYASHQAGLEMIRQGQVDLDHYWGTIS
jgi:N4-(beta-N-acetylglucosaminyl)-L-asparaginase